MIELILVAVLVLIFSWLWNRMHIKASDTKQTVIVVPDKWKSILTEKVLFYKQLSDSQKHQFESDVFNFLHAIKIIGIETDVTLEDKLLVASSAVIPLFGFPAWTYKHLDEVLLYPSSFDRNFNLNNPDEIITGMVGNGPMEGKVILSKPSLHAGFDISNDKRNVGIHEFVHLFDKETGAIDGIPPGYEDKSHALPWIDFIRLKTEQILDRESDIDCYATTNRQEFLAVVSEYFFERPHLLKQKHPLLYEHLTKVFRQDTSLILQENEPLEREIGRNELCPCGSGKKYKKCCIK